MHCGRVSNLLSAYIDRELAGAEMLPIRRHLDLCPGCAAEHEALRRVKSLLASAPPPELSGDSVAAVMRRWDERGAAASSTPRHAPDPAPRSGWSWKWMELPPVWQRFGMAFAAVFVVLALVATTAALRKPNYPDALASNVLLKFSETEERVPRPRVPYATVNWDFGLRAHRWPGPLGLQPPSLLVSDTLPYGGR
jgi:anti-sigma factor RsiW